jgi:hypothetical protein
MKDISEGRCSAMGLTWSQMVRCESKWRMTLGFHNSPGRKFFISCDVPRALIFEWRGRFPSIYVLDQEVSCAILEMGVLFGDVSRSGLLPSFRQT